MKAARISEAFKHLTVWFILGIELLPLYMMLQVSWKNNAEFISNPWLPSSPAHWHWENWLGAIRLVLPYLANTIFVSVTATVATLVCAVPAAYFFARQRVPLKGALWSLFMLLLMMPSIANLVPLFSLLRELSLLNTLTALMLVAVATAQAFNIFVLRNFIEEIPHDLFEAAAIDGAGHLARIRHVVLPMASPIIGTLSILSFLNRWNEFLLPLVLLRDRSKFVLGVGLVYLDGEYIKPWGQIMAAYLMASIPLILLFLFSMRLFVRGLSEGAIKG